MQNGASIMIQPSLTKQALQVINNASLHYTAGVAEKDYFLALVSKIINESALGSKLAFKGGTIDLFGLRLRIVRSPKNRRAREPWYILPNDHRSSRNKVVKICYHRFKIEETFKDMKHIFELKRTRLNKPLSLKLLLWFVSLGIALLYHTTQPTKTSTTNRHQTHPKKQTSWLRQATEQLQQASGLVFWGQG
jgi:hypothetical protein